MRVCRGRVHEAPLRVVVHEGEMGDPLVLLLLLPLLHFLRQAGPPFLTVLRLDMIGRLPPGSKEEDDRIRMRQDKVS